MPFRRVTCDVMPTNPLATFREYGRRGGGAVICSRLLMADASEDYEQQPRTCRPEPWAQIRGSGGPQGDKQCPEDYQRFDVNVYSQNQMEADLISRQIFRAMPAFFAQGHGVCSVMSTGFFESYPWAVFDNRPVTQLFFGEDLYGVDSV